MIQLSVVFNERSKPLRKKDGCGPIQIKAYENGERKLFPTGLYVLPKNWSAKEHQVIHCEQAAYYNAEARRQMKTLEDFILKRSYLNAPPTLSQCVEFVKKGEQKSFTQFMALEMNARQDLSPNTRKKDKSALNHFMKFKEDVLFAELSIELVRAFRNYLLKRMTPNSANSYHKRIKYYIGVAVDMENSDLIERNPYRKLKLKDTPVDRFSLTMLQVEALEALKFTEDEFFLETKRDMFLVCCYLGFRYSDMIKIKRRDFVEDHKGWCYLLKATKTGKTLHIPLYLLFDGKPERLLYRYFEQTSIDHQNLFYPYTGQTLNRDLKIIAERAGIEQHQRVTSKVGRTTFASQMVKHMNLSYVKELLQHADIQTTMDYVQVGNRDIVEALEKVTW